VTAQAPVLEVEGVSKSFPGVRALEEVGFELRPGEVHALLGENGAGKSTLIKILCGVHRPDAGTIRLGGEPVRVTSPRHAQALAIAVVHQELALEPYLSVAENVFLGRQPVGRFGLIDRRRMREETGRLLSRLGVAIDPDTPLGELPVASRQLVAIARAVSSSARVLVFDEPTTSLTQHESDLLFAAIRRLRADGIGIVYVSHRMQEIFDLCDRVTVLRDGRRIATMPVAETDRAGLIGMMIGRDIGALLRAEAGPKGRPVLEARNLGRRGVLHGISLAVHEGEIVGMAGLVGAGRTEVARALFGDLATDSGEILVEGLPVRVRSPRDAVRAGIGLVPEDRKEQGLVTALPVRQNLAMPSWRRLAKFGILRGGAERRLAEEYVRRLAIRTPSIAQAVKHLSGGNQQRVVIAKWLATRPKVLIVDEPTRGVDVGAQAETHGLLRDLARAGMAVLMISSDLREILTMSDRILVMHAGRIVAELPGAGATQEEIMYHAAGEGGRIKASTMLDLESADAVR
jgi:ABC-type sugar transport system ATPase subunit